MEAPSPFPCVPVVPTVSSIHAQMEIEAEAEAEEQEAIELDAFLRSVVVYGSLEEQRRREYDGNAPAATRGGRGNHIELVTVHFARRALAPGVYDVDVSRDGFAHAFRSLRDKHRRCVHKRLKEYAFDDMVCENYDNQDVKIYRVDSVNYVPLLGWDCVAVHSTKDKIPISGFPCTKNLDAVHYVKRSVIKVSGRISVCFESRMPDVLRENEDERACRRARGPTTVSPSKRCGGDGRTEAHNPLPHSECTADARECLRVFIQINVTNAAAQTAPHAPHAASSASMDCVDRYTDEDSAGNMTAIPFSETVKKAIDEVRSVLIESGAIGDDSSPRAPRAPRTPHS